MSINSPESLPPQDPDKDKDKDRSAGKKDADDGGIPGGSDGVGIGADTEPNSFEPEEDPEATEKS
ncbi:hypothetical protein ACRB8A_16740 [Arthrobacter sp. G.S.26]|uniref:hypothetical protein n=1 Tax=Arthrobacter sp. G.S.26 TaxID=3433706 RepID=UPI003D7830C4